MFKKWDIVYCSKFPDTVHCEKCSRDFSIVKHACTYCGEENLVSNFIGKPRPVILWLDQESWHKSMAFGIPLSKTGLMNNPFNHIVQCENYVFKHADQKYFCPMRAVIHQATRIDGNVLHGNQIIGSINDSLLMDTIENKLFEWLFRDIATKSSI